MDVVRLVDKVFLEVLILELLVWLFLIFSEKKLSGVAFTIFQPCFPKTKDISEKSNSCRAYFSLDSFFLTPEALALTSPISFVKTKKVLSASALFSEEIIKPFCCIDLV
ncbi:MAG: hypothetical protein R3B65_00910 [Candidatus Paceibacterota bacterium]